MGKQTAKLSWMIEIYPAQLTEKEQLMLIHTWWIESDVLTIGQNDAYLPILHLLKGGGLNVKNFGSEK